jgi:hypothetical protein
MRQWYSHVRTQPSIVATASQYGGRNLPASRLDQAANILEQDCCYFERAMNG